MIRESLLYLSESAAANKLVTGTPIARRLAERFVAGETMEDAVRVARASNELGLSVSLDYLGEAVSTTE
jgi:proline dehydrogenase